MRFFKLLILAVSSGPVLCLAGPALSLEFHKTVLQGEKTESVSGRACYRAPLSAVFDITNPIRQRMIFRSNTLLLYYPDRSEGLRIRSRSPVLMPFFHEFLIAFSVKSGFKGLILAKSEKKGATEFQYWEAAKALPDGTERLLLVLKDGLPNLAEAKTKKGKLVFRAEYHDYFRWGPYRMPGRVETLRHDEDGSPIRTEITYAPSKEAVTIDPFKIPADTRWKDIKW
jgi:hypothetical protein